MQKGKNNFFETKVTELIGKTKNSRKVLQLLGLTNKSGGSMVGK